MSRETATSAKHRSSDAAERAGEEALKATETAIEFFREYARQRPEVVALWAFGVGFVLGWKLKPW
jgi:hypothetical protein